MALNKIGTINITTRKLENQQIDYLLNGVKVTPTESKVEKQLDHYGNEIGPRILTLTFELERHEIIFATGEKHGNYENDQGC
jgi:hypothetical protein